MTIQTIQRKAECENRILTLLSHLPETVTEDPLAEMRMAATFREIARLADGMAAMIPSPR